MADMNAGRANSTSPRRRASRPPRRIGKGTVLLIVAALAFIVGIPVYGYYDFFIAPLREPVVKVNDVPRTREEMIKRLHYLDAVNRMQGRPSNLGSLPLELVFNLRDEEIILQSAPRVGISATPEEITAVIKNRLLGAPAAGDASTPEELDREFQGTYRGYLSQVGLSDQEYRAIIQQEVLRQKLRARLSERIPAVTEHAHVFAIKLQNIDDALDVVDRLAEGGDFGAEARGHSIDEASKELSGDLGWIPKGGLERSFDDTVFTLPLHEVSEPVFADGGVWIAMVTEHDPARRVEGDAKERLEDRALVDWLAEELEKNDVELYFDSATYAYVIRKAEEFRR